MNPILLSRLILTTVIGSTAVLASCDKPTSGSNNTEYRDGASGASSGSIMKDTEGGNTEPPAKNRD